MALVILDGPLGTQLFSRGIATPPPGWSAAALDTAPDVVRAIHAEYASAGAQVHTANTFRTKARSVGRRWRELAERAVALARSAVPSTHRVAGSIAPLEDCYRPDLSPDAAACHREHAELAVALHRAGVDLLLCETFPAVAEAVIAVEEAKRTGLETWVAFTAGPTGDLLTPAALREGAREAVARGASAVLVSCTNVVATTRLLEELAPLGVPFGAYANAGGPTDGLGWGGGAEHDDAGAARYADAAERWISLGATLVGSCCGTGPAHIAALAERFGTKAPQLAR